MKKILHRWQTSRSHQSGQVLLIVVLTMVVALTVGLSVVTRTISDLQTSKQNEESQRAFQAAEAGLDHVLDRIQNEGDYTSGKVPLDNASEFDVTLEKDEDYRQLINNGDQIDQNIGFDIWLSEYPNMINQYSGPVNIYYGENSAPNRQDQCTGSGERVSPALEVLILTGTKASPTFQKEVYDNCPPASAPRPASNTGPTEVGDFEIEGKMFRYRVNLNISSGLIMKIIPIYNSTTAAVEFLDPNNIPTQGVKIESTGYSGETVRKVEYFLAYPQIPNELFPYSIISQ